MRVVLGRVFVVFALICVFLCVFFFLSVLVYLGFVVLDQSRGS